MLNNDLYEKYLQKKARKLGISVEELKNNNIQTVKEIQETPVAPQPSTYSGNVVLENRVNDTREEKYALIGYPLGHSLSKIIHDSGFKSSNVNARYDILETSPEDFVEILKKLKRENYKGFNITIPFKIPITMFINKADETANVVGAVNTVLINQDKTLTGYNTDVLGFQKALPKDVDLTNKVAGILGTGGASRAATVALVKSGIKSIRFYTRNIPNSLNLLNYMRKVFPDVEFNAFQIEHIKDLSMVDILVNATPIGMLGYSADLTPVEKSQLSTLPEHAIVYDVIYNPKKTILIKLAEELGYKTVNGIDMLLHQAIAAEEIWTGKTPNFDTMKIDLLNNL